MAYVSKQDFDLNVMVGKIAPRNGGGCERRRRAGDRISFRFVHGFTFAFGIGKGTVPAALPFMDLSTRGAGHLSSGPGEQPDWLSIAGRPNILPRPAPISQAKTIEHACAGDTPILLIFCLILSN